MPSFRRRAGTFAVVLLPVAVLTPVSAGTGPTAPPSATAGFRVVVTPGGPIDASTYNPGSFQVTNTSTGGETITRLRLDLSTAILPDLVFDPLGTAGDLVARCFTADAGAATTGLVPPADPCVTPFGGPHDGGYDDLTLDFTGFGPDETFTFSVDIDPTVIRGADAPGPGESGSVSGLELTGAVVEATFAGGGVLPAQLFRSAGSEGGSEVTAPTLAALPAPVVQVQGVAATPATVAPGAQVVRVTGPPGAAVRLLRVEAALYTSGLAGGGFDVDPFEADSAVQVGESSATLDASGGADIEITLTRAGPEGGLNHLVAAFRDSLGRTGPVSAPVVLVPEDCSGPPLRGPTLSVSRTDISWTHLAGATAYDLLRGDLEALRDAGGDFSTAVAACFADGWTATSWREAAKPSPGAAWFYLARGVSCGGAGTYDSGGTGQVSSRDAGIAAAPASCP